MIRSFLLVAVLATPALAQTSETITVTATRNETRVADTPTSVVVISRETLETTAAPTIDDALRQVPGFTLYRRTGSRVANPTAQGVSMRGVGASGASRVLVLDDGIPLNDPFGGWVYWGRVSPLSLDRIEVLRGGGSELYGSAAVGGVVQFIRRRDDALTAEVSAGTASTYTARAFAAGSRGAWRGAVNVDVVDTGGYVLVERDQRGAIDRAADASHTAVDMTVYRGSMFLRASQFDESRNNGTPLQTNATTTRQIAFGAELGSIGVRAWGGDQDYEQTFSAIAADRNSERLTVEQRVPSRNAGVTAQWSRPAGSRHAVVAGVEGRQVSGTSEEQATRAGGRQRTLAAFAEDIVMISPALSLTAGVRVDRWREDLAWSPRVAMLYRASEALALTASAYRAFRAPTLNELYRGFRVGNVVTLANESLGPETLSAVEAGLRVRHLRMVLFWMEMDDVVANVTITATPSVITRQRQNVGGSRSRGAEIEGEWRLTPHLRATAGYLFSDAILSTGRRVPQVPRHQATAQLAYSGSVITGLQARWSTMQFDDDRNELPLRGYVVVDAFASRPLAGGLTVMMAIENITDTRIEAGATPVITVGQPRAMRIGLRYGR